MSHTELCPTSFNREEEEEREMFGILSMYLTSTTTGSGETGAPSESSFRLKKT